MRIDKYLCDTLNLTRSEAKKVIASGRVCADGAVIRSASFQIEVQNVFLDGQPVAYQKFYYVMLNKPKDTVCANTDAKSKTVFDLLPSEYRRKGLFVCGRLDKDSTGLVLITNDGETAHKLLSPKYIVYKRYRVKLEKAVTDRDIQKLKQGIMTAAGNFFLPAEYERITENEGIITIYEGKYHEIKRIFAALENHVIALHRLSIHGLELDSQLQPGECRYLNAEEIERIRNLTPVNSQNA